MPGRDNKVAGWRFARTSLRFNRRRLRAVCTRCLRFAVDAPSGGIIDASFPRPFTIYAGNVEDVSFGVGDFARTLTNCERRNQRRRERGRTGVEPGRSRQANRGGLERRDERRREVLRKTTRTRKTMPSTNGPKSVERKGLAPQVGLEPTTLRLTAECSTIELLRSKLGRRFELITTDARARCQILHRLLN